MSPKPYPEYKDSGFDWLGALPTGWEARRLKFGFDLQKRPIASDMDIVTAFRDGEVTLRKNRRLGGYTEGDKQIGYQGIESGDLVIHAMDAFAGAIGVSDSRGKSTPVYNVCRPKPGVNARFFALALRHLALTGYIESLSKGIRERSTDFRWADAKNVIVPFPPQHEQYAIVDYLDRETAEIDAFIADQEELIALLAERRTTTITQAVTKGLDPNAPMKDSGVDWLGDVPEGWSVQRLSHVTSAVIDCLHSTPEKSDEGKFISIRTSCIRDGELFPEKGLTIDEPTFRERTAKGTPEAGDVFFTREAPAGEAALVDNLGHYALGQRMVLLKPSSELLDSRFLLWNIYMPHVRRYIDIEANGSTVKNLPIPDIKSIPIVVPRKDQQQRIIGYLNREISEIDEAIADARASIALSKERRAAVISAAVTGKIDVRSTSVQATNKVEAESVGVA
ncbi:restriction endonuclease subunit S [Paeniglutamicibacter sulfureus]|uniref:Type I restriction enzyme S subunit n=1 Tax=Paeniglutamicibacter sulfureus TaxID=43666 RepID=A0ABU2BMA6_9MICC|nr:restriction endonuclease subunit S [Paeniglutamicibacter sulfureus]MDR7358843.1 type I restriction enzyme S subunit [Paeniglutamicibacter sulfureus]